MDKEDFVQEGYTTNPQVGGSNPPGRAYKYAVLERLSARLSSSYFT